MPLIVHHLQVSQSERIPWLCEELGIDYELILYKRAPLLAPPEYKALHPMGAAPVIQDGDLTMAESCAVIEYICHKYADGKLFLQWPHPAYADFLYWWHWVDGTFFSSIARGVQARSGDVNPILAKINRFESGLNMLDERLRDNEWLAGNEFTAADIMLVFALTTFRYFYLYSLGDYPNVVKYLQRIGAREAYQKAMAKSDPGMELLLGHEPPKESLM